MPNVARKVEVAANVAIIVVAVLLAAVLTRQYLYPGQSPQQAQRAAARPMPQSGDPVTLADVDWKQNGKTLLIAVSTNCRFCTQSGPFYQRLVKEHGGAQLIALVPQSADEGRAYMKQLGVEISDVRQVSFEDLKVSGTPTLILVDGGGKVDAAWVGALPPDKENEVIGRLRAD